MEKKCDESCYFFEEHDEKRNPWGGKYKRPWCKKYKRVLFLTRPEAGCSNWINKEEQKVLVRGW